MVHASGSKLFLLSSKTGKNRGKRLFWKKTVKNAPCTWQTPPSLKVLGVKRPWVELANSLDVGVGNGAASDAGRGVLHVGTWMYMFCATAEGRQRHNTDSQTEDNTNCTSTGTLL